MATTLAELRDELLAAIDADIAANKNPGEGKISFLADVQNALAAGGGGGGGGGVLTQSQTRDAVRDGANASTLVVGLRGAPILATLTPAQINAGATVAEAATTVRQRLLINNSDQPVYWNPGTVTPTATNYDHAIVPGGYLEPTYLGECRVFGVGLTAGELRIRDYS